LKKGDVILEVNGERVESPEDLLNEVSRSKDTLQFRIAPGFYNKNTIKTQQVSFVIFNASYFYLLYFCYY
jgi:S1-C subfamily serine protease